MNATGPLTSPKALQRQCVLEDAGTYDAATRQRFAADATALDAEIPHWLHAHQEGVRLLEEIASEALVAMAATETEVAEAEDDIQEAIERHSEDSSELRSIMQHCTTVANILRPQDDNDLVYELRLLWTAFAEVDDGIRGVYLEAHPDTTLTGQELEDVIRDWMFNNMEAIAEAMTALIGPIESFEYGTGPGRDHLESAFSGLSATAQAFVNGVPALHRIFVEPVPEDAELIKLMNKMGNTLCY